MLIYNHKITVNTTTTQEREIKTMKTTNKKAMSFEQLVKYTARTIDSQSVFNNIDMRRMKNDSVSVKYKDRNKRICRIDTAYDKIRFTTDRTVMFKDIENVSEHVKTNCRVYATVLVDKSEFEYTLYKICENANILADADE